jgi:hypothetical protein
MDRLVTACTHRLLEEKRRQFEEERRRFEAVCVSVAPQYSWFDWLHIQAQAQARAQTSMSDSIKSSVSRDSSVRSLRSVDL